MSNKYCNAGGSWLLVFFGVILLIGGTLVIVASSVSGTVDLLSMTFGFIMMSMGLVVSYAALKTKDRKEHVAITVAYPLSYAEFALDNYQEKLKEKSGNRAFGFVLISLGTFVLSIFGVVGGYVPWSLTFLGVCCLGGGIVLWTKK